MLISLRRRPLRGEDDRSGNDAVRDVGDMWEEPVAMAVLSEEAVEDVLGVVCDPLFKPDIISSDNFSLPDFSSRSPDVLLSPSCCSLPSNPGTWGLIFVPSSLSTVRGTWGKGEELETEANDESEWAQSEAVRLFPNETNSFISTSTGIAGCTASPFSCMTHEHITHRTNMYKMPYMRYIHVHYVVLHNTYIAMVDGHTDSNS